VTLSVEPLVPDGAADTAKPRVAVVASATFYRDVLAFVLDDDSAFEVSLSVVSLDELDHHADNDVDIAVVVLPDDTGVAVLARSGERSWSEQFTNGGPIVIVGWDTPTVELRRLLKRALSINGTHAAPTGSPPALALRRLTDRELEVLILLAHGRSTTDTATELGISPHTVRTHVTNLLRRLGAHSRLQAVAQTRDHLSTEKHRRSVRAARDVC
jgi:DNA-binding CsgD family transcriptional regulator